MATTFKYLTHSDDDEKWGLFLNVVGHAKIMAGEDYPPTGHPENYHFNREEGRILDEYQLLYITRGSGILETKSQKIEICEGSILLLHPFVWHRYHPNNETGWTEFYVGFNGSIAKQVMELFPANEPLKYIGFNEQVHQAYTKLFDLVDEEKSGYQQTASSYILFILGSIRQIVLNNSFADNKLEKVINQSRLYMRSNLTRQFSMEEMAKQLNVSYSLFRIEFKKYTGMPPGQYLLQLRIQAAKQLLSNTKLSVKEIAFRTGFESQFYFSKMFKKHVGTPPVTFREMGAESRKSEL